MAKQNVLKLIEEAAKNKTEKLDLSYNQLTDLPPEIVKLTNLTTLDLSGNPLISPPPEIVKQGNRATLMYLRKLPDEKIEHNEAKLNLVILGLLFILQIDLTCAIW
jgi:Leucine-rich repeat (LRR) protein